MSALATWYPFIKQWHIALVALSGTLFVARGIGVLAGARWPMRPAPRFASVAIDTLLLAAGATLWALLQLNPLRERWLGAKLILLVVYVVLGTWALRRARTPFTRIVFLLAALAVFATMIGIALAHDAAGFWRFLPPS
jgi:uncharacterized membrane protein SirB2